jgi:bacillithiol system protein YtxJ
LNKIDELMKWIPLNLDAQLGEIKSSKGYSLLFKHSTRCSISSMAKRNFELNWDDLPSDTQCYFLDLLNFRSISSQIAADFGIAHQSPQLLLIKDGECILEQSHSDISVEEVNEVINQAKA